MLALQSYSTPLGMAMDVGTVRHLVDRRQFCQSSIGLAAELLSVVDGVDEYGLVEIQQFAGVLMRG